MSGYQIKWNLPAFRAMRYDPATIGALRRAGRAMQASAGPGYEMSEYRGASRPRVTVITGTAEAMRDNARNATLARSINAA